MTFHVAHGAEWRDARRVAWRAPRLVTAASLFGACLSGCAGGAAGGRTSSRGAAEARPHASSHPIHVVSNGVVGPTYWLEPHVGRLPAGLFEGASDCTSLVTETSVNFWCPSGQISLQVLGCYPYSYESSAPPPVSFGATLQDESQVTIVLDCAQAAWPIGPRQ